MWPLCSDVCVQHSNRSRLGPAYRRPTRVALLCALFGLAIALPSRATCATDAPVSACVNSNSLWIPAGDARFFAIARPVATRPLRVAVAYGLQALFEPLRAEVPSPNDTGRDVALVDFALDQDLSLAMGLGEELEVGVSISTILHQRGTGFSGLSSQRGSALPSTADRDPRLSLARALTISSALKVKARAEVAIPLGSTSAYQSTGSITLAPGVALEWTSGPLALAADVSLRLRPSVELGSARMGSQGLAAVGVALDALPARRLAVNLEAWVAASLVETTSARGRAAGIETSYVPAEWLLSLRSHPEHGAPWSIALGAGAGLALSHDTWGGSRLQFLAPTSPTWRALAEVRYAPGQE